MPWEEGDAGQTNLLALNAAIEEQGAATSEITRNVQQAASGTQEVAHTIVGVSTAAHETGAAASQVLGAATELSQQSDACAARSTPSSQRSGRREGAVRGTCSGLGPAYCPKNGSTCGSIIP